MLPIERHRQIMEELNLQGRVLVVELVKLCRVSQEAMRRDLSQLEKKGLLQRSHGGAVLAQKHQGSLAGKIINLMSMNPPSACGWMKTPRRKH